MPKSELRKTRLMALGRSDSEAYRPIHCSLTDTYDLTFVPEKRFDSARDAIRFFFQSGCDAILFPNPYANSKRRGIYYLAKDLGIQTVVFDRGALPGSWFFDSGFNADSSTYYLSAWDHPLSEDEKAQTEVYIRELRTGTSTLEEQGAKTETITIREKYGLRGKKLLFAPLQRPSDTVIKFFSGNIRRYDDFIRHLERLHKTFEDNDEWVLLCKKHPLETSVASDKLFMADESENVHALLDTADAVVCVNSGVGLLSVLHDTPVFHFGRAFYSHPKLTRQVQSYADILHNLQHGLFSVDRDTRTRLCHHLRARVYSFGTLVSELAHKKDGSKYRRTTGIEFDRLRFPTIRQIPDDKPSCLFVTPVVPAPINRGSVARTQQMLDSLLAAGCSVDLQILNMSYADKSKYDIEIDVRNRFPAIRHVNVIHHPRLKRRGTTLKRFFIRLPDRVRSLVARARGVQYCVGNASDLPVKYLLESRFAGRNKRLPYDLIWSNYAKMVTPSTRKLGRKVVVDTHDVQALRIENDILSSFTPGRAASLSRTVRASERALLRQCDRIIAISSVDEDFFNREWGLDTRTVLVEAAMPAPTVSLQTALSADAVFIGSASVANINSLAWFIGDVAPFIDRSATRGLTIRVVGEVATAKRIVKLVETTRFAKLRIILDGFVHSLGAVYTSSRIVVAPIVQGSGMKIKIVEALSYGKAIVGTTTAFDGIGVVHGTSALVSDDAAEFARNVTKLCCDDTLRKDLELQARVVFDNNHSQQRSNRQVRDLVGSLIPHYSSNSGAMAGVPAKAG